jgi:hypothetical protein
MQPRPWDVGNDSEILVALGRVSIADLSQYMREKGVKSDCASCGRNDWAIVPPAVGILTIPSSTPQALAGPTVSPSNFGAPAVCLECNHCGFMRMYNALQIGLWKLDSERKAGNGK